jgi:hypothetical protein
VDDGKREIGRLYDTVKGKKRLIVKIFVVCIIAVLVI